MMAKLYWRVKVNGKWTWRPANVSLHDSDGIRYWYTYDNTEEEE